LVGYKGSKQSTPYAAEILTKEILTEAKQYGLTEV
jgi:ribosomal protein S11